MVMLTVAVFVGSAFEVAVIITVWGEATVAAGVKTPVVALMVPAAALSIVQVLLVSTALVTVAPVGV